MTINIDFYFHFKKKIKNVSISNEFSDCDNDIYKEAKENYEICYVFEKNIL
jgi:hypothetical protein